MRAAVVTRYGPPEVVVVRDVPPPTPGRGQVVVRVVATAVSSGDARIRGARFPRGFAVPARLALGLRRPRRAVLGSAYAGVVEAVGDEVTDLRPGDRVAGMNGTRLGAHAELVAVDAAATARIPVHVSDDDAAGVLFGGTTAAWFLRDRATIRPGATVLVNGAAGAVGTNAVQLARHLGAEVTGVTRAANADLVRSLGAAHVVDHTRHDVRDLAERYDVVLDAVGNLSTGAGRRLLRPGGVLLLPVASLGQLVGARGPVRAGMAPERVDDVRWLLDLVGAGQLTVVHDSAHPLDRIVDAHRRVDTGRKVGNVLVHPAAA